MGEFHTYLVHDSLGLTVILNNQLELVAAASHLLEGVSSGCSIMSVLMQLDGFTLWTGRNSEKSSLQPSRDAPVHKLSWNESDWRCDWITEQ